MSKSKTQDSKERISQEQKLLLAEDRANASGGSAAAGGMNLHARVASVAAVHLLSGHPLGWLKELEVDIPQEIWCETNGPGDDLRFVLGNDKVLEAQAKKGLRRGPDLWKALESLARGIHSDEIDYGVLVIDTDASLIIKRELSRGIRRLGDGRDDLLHEIAIDFKCRIELAEMSVQKVCSRLRIVLVHCADHDDASEMAARAILLHICSSSRDAENAWANIQLSAHGLIERQGRWTNQSLLSILKTARVELRSNPDEAYPTTISGCAWDSLEESSQHRGFIQSFRQHYLISEQTGAQPFGGRDEECSQLDSWLFDVNAPCRRLLCAPTARGKSAMLVQWTERLVCESAWTIVFVPISLRFNTDRPVIFYSLLATQLARVMHVKLTLPSTDLDAYYQGVSFDLLSRAIKESRKLLIVVDGLDEAQGLGFSPTIFPPILPPTIRILVSAREQAGDRGPDGWLKRLDWQGKDVISGGLSTLNRDAVIPIFESVGIDKEIVTHDLIDRLMVLSAGEPLLLALYAEDLSGIFRSENKISLGNLEGLSPGFAAYFSRVFDSYSQGEHGAQETVDATLAVLAMAVGPLEGQHLTDLTCQLARVPRPLALDRFVKPLRRFIAGDGRDDHGYVLNHPKLSEYLREERFDVTTRKNVECLFIEWGRSVAKELTNNLSVPAPIYVLQHHTEHLRRSGEVLLDDVELLLSEGWKIAWYQIEKGYGGYAESLLSAAGSMQSSRKYSDDASRAIRLKFKIALLVGSVKSQGVNVPSELVAMALEEGLVTLRQAINISKLQRDENRPGYLLELANGLPVADLEKLLLEVNKVVDIESRNHQLIKLAHHLPENRRREILDSVLSWLYSVEYKPSQISMVNALAPMLDGIQLKKLVDGIISKAIAGCDLESMILSLPSVIQYLHKKSIPDSLSKIVDLCLKFCDTSVNMTQLAMMLIALEPWVCADRIELGISRLMRILEEFSGDGIHNVSGYWDINSDIKWERYTHASLILVILNCRFLPLDDYSRVLSEKIDQLCVPEYSRLHILIDVAPLIKAEFREAIVKRIYRFAVDLPSANNRTHALMGLAHVASKNIRSKIIEDALFNANFIEDEYLCARTLVSLFSTLSLIKKEEGFDAILEDIQKVKYSLHLGDLLLELSSQLPLAKDFEDVGLQNVIRSYDFGNGLSTVFRNFDKISENKKRAVFQFFWGRILEKPEDTSAHMNMWMAAKYATKFWTLKEFEIAWSRLPNVRSDLRFMVTASILKVAQNLGFKSLFKPVIAEASEQDDPRNGLSFAVTCLDFLPESCELRLLLNKFWFLSVDAESQGVQGLVEGYKLLDAAAQEKAWPILKTFAGKEKNLSQAYALLSTVSKDSVEKAQFVERAMAAYASETAEDRMSKALHIISVCNTTEEKWQALDLLTSVPSVSRSSVFSAIGLIAPILREVGGESLIEELMSDVRQATTWWP